MPGVLIARASASASPAAPTHPLYGHVGPVRVIDMPLVLTARESTAPAAPYHHLVNCLLTLWGHAHAVDAHGPRVRLGGAGRT